MGHFQPQWAQARRAKAEKTDKGGERGERTGGDWVEQVG